MTRQEVYEAVWKEPLTTVAKKMALSPSALRKSCLDANIPVPPRGHWVQVSIGRGRDPKPLQGRKEEPFVPRKRDLAGRQGLHPFELAQVMAMGVGKPASCPASSTVPGALAIGVGDLELASQEWGRQRQLLEFLVRVEEAIGQLPQAQGEAPLSALRSARAALSRRDPIQTVLAALTVGQG